jgi:vancomycin resistance protein VanW
MLIWQIDGRKYALTSRSEKLPFRMKKHQSKLLRKLGDADMRLQHNKVDNLRIVIECINGLIIKPGETFSFYKLVGRPTKSRGFKEGIELSFGKARAGVLGISALCTELTLFYFTYHGNKYPSE